jgi:hypothetical protein
LISHKSAIAFLQHFQGMSFQEAVKCLLAFHGRARGPPRVPTTSQNPKKEKQLFQLPEPSADHRRVFAYLCKRRRIAPQVIRAFLFSGLLQLWQERLLAVRLRHGVHGDPGRGSDLRTDYRYGLPGGDGHAQADL